MKKLSKDTLDSHLEDWFGCYREEHSPIFYKPIYQNRAKEIEQAYTQIKEIIEEHFGTVRGKIDNEAIASSLISAIRYNKDLFTVVVDEHNLSKEFQKRLPEYTPIPQPKQVSREDVKCLVMKTYGRPYQDLDMACDRLEKAMKELGFEVVENE